MGRVRCTCPTCGWATRRKVANIHRPCRGCGGEVEVNADDAEEVMLAAIAENIAAAIEDEEGPKPHR